MSLSKTALNTLLAGAVLATLAGAAGNMAFAEDAAMSKEKCYGVVKAGANDCAAANGSHSCAGQAKVDGDGGSFVALPKGVCEKLVGGSTTPKG
jgi:uncharacterized membrane protein